MHTFDLSALDVITCRVCEQNMGWETSINGHRVEYRKLPPGAQYEMGYVCDCPGFRFRHKCKHIAEADKMRCKWGAGAFCGSWSEPNADGTCPDCGGPTRIIRVRI